MEQVREETARNHDIVLLNQLLEAVYHRIKHLAILQTELAKSLVPMQSSGSFKATENINTKLIRRDFLAKQTQISTNWILTAPLLEAEDGGQAQSASPSRYLRLMNV